MPASTIRAYLEAKAQQPNNEWLRREPRTTHPDILEAVRAHCAAGGFYNDDTERHVESVAGDLPEHRHHGHAKRDRLTDQLGHEVYLAKSILTDEENANSEAAARAEGYTSLAETNLVDGLFYLVRIGTQYSGQREAVYSEPRKLKARADGTRIVFMPPKARTRGIVINGPALVKEA